MGGEGERLHSERRKRFWLTLGGLTLIGVVGGLVGGFIKGIDAGSPPSPAALWLAVAGVVLFVALFIYGSWKFFVSVDEVEVADNLWGSLIGFYTYATLLPAWWAFDKLGFVGEPNQWVIYAASLIVTFVVYIYRKWRFS